MKNIKYFVVILLILQACKPVKEELPESDFEDISIEGVNLKWRDIQMIDENVGYVGGVLPNTFHIIYHQSLSFPFKDTLIYNLDHSYKDEDIPILPILYRTLDGGKTWEAIKTPFRNAVHQLCFIDKNNGFVTSSNEGVYRTTDGGMNWVRVLSHHFQDGTSFSGGEHFLNFKDPYNGYAFISSSYPFETTNGGYTWELSSVQKRCLYIKGDIAYFQDNNSIIKTTDGANTFTKLSLPIKYESTFYFKSVDCFYVAFESKMYETKDGGENWKTYNIPVYNFDNFFVDGNELFYTSGYEISNVTFPITDTKLPNLYWMKRPDKTRINDIYFLNSKIGYVVGDNGLILKYTGR